MFVPELVIVLVVVLAYCTGRAGLGEASGAGIGLRRRKLTGQQSPARPPIGRFCERVSLGVN